MDKIINRFKEPSSWAALGVALGLFGIEFSPEVVEPVVQVGTGLALIVAFFLKESGSDA